MFSYPFTVFENYLVLLPCGFCEYSNKWDQKYCVCIFKSKDEILLGLKITFDQNYTHSKKNSNMIIKQFNLDNTHIYIETPERTIQKAFICTSFLLLEYGELCENMQDYRLGNSYPGLHD